MAGRPRRRRVRESYKGMPESLVALYESGQRVRYNGFWLNESERDRIVAEFIDANPQDVAEMIKDFLYRKSLDREEAHPALDIEPLRQELGYIVALIERLERRLERGVSIRETERYSDAESEGAQRTLDALSRFST